MTDPTTIGTLVLTAMLVLLLLRIPIAVVLIMAGYAGVVLVVATRGGGFDLQAGMDTAASFLGKLPYSSTAEYTFTTIPMFLLMGYLASEARFTADIYAAARLWLVRVPGGLAVASAVGCAVFAAISGSSLATAAAMGRMAVPEMLRAGYQKALSTGVVAAGGTLGSLIPPGILLIIYGVFTEQSIAQLFVAGVIPGILSLGVYVAVIVIRVKLNPSLAPAISGEHHPREKWQALSRIWAMVLLIVLIIGGLYSGMFTPSEGGAIGAVMAFLICVVARRLSWSGLSEALGETVKTTAMLFAAIIGAYMVTSFFALTGIASAISSWAGSLGASTYVVLLSLTVLYVFLGTFMGSIEIMLLTLPVVIPLVEGLGLDLIWFGIIMIKYLEIGLISPPIGLNCFIIKGMVGDEVSLADIFKGASWFILADLVTIVLLVMFPSLVLFLPAMMTN